VNQGMIRSPKERIIQSIAFEVLGLILVAPLYTYFTSSSVSESVSLLVAISLIAMLWIGLHNATYDKLEWKLLETVASKRLLRFRVIHALSLEITTTIVSVPVILLMTDLSLLEAMVVEVLLTVAYTAFGFVFNYMFDYFRPVKTGELYG